MAGYLQAINLGGRTVWVEVSPLEPQGSGKTVATSAGAARQARTATDQLAEADIGPTLAAVIEPVREALKRYGPDEVQLEVAIGIKGEVGFFIARGEGNASIKVTAKWTYKDE